MATKTATFSYEQLNQAYEARTTVVRCECQLATECVGGQPAGEDGIRMFVRHHLKLTDPKEAEEAVKRILKEEVGTKDTTPESGELDEKMTYGVNVIRRTEHGPWLGDWMVKANLKNAFSRLGIFRQIIGTKGNLAEAGRVRAIGNSLLEPGHPERIYLTDENGKAVQTYFQEFMGRVSTPQGFVSIIHHSECAPPGSRFAFEYRMLNGKLKMEDIRDAMALAMVVGVGSTRSMERGKYRILSCEIEIPEEKKKPKEKNQNGIER